MGPQPVIHHGPPGMTALLGSAGGSKVLLPALPGKETVCMTLMLSQRQPGRGDGSKESHAQLSTGTLGLHSLSLGSRVPVGK